MDSLLPTTYGTFSDLMANYTSTDSNMVAHYSNADATAEGHAFMAYVKAHPATLSDGMDIISVENNQFSAFLASERKWYAGDFRIPFLGTIFNKWIGYAGAAGAFYFLVLK